MSVHRDEVKPVQAKLDGNGGKVDMLKAALWYAHLGLPVVPLHTPTADGCSCGNADCSSVGKHPRTYNGVRAATTDQTTIQRWWKRWPRANIGIAIDGELAVVDIDGAASWDWLRGQHLPESPRVLTGGGNLHIYIKAPPQTVGDIVLWSDGQGSEVRLKGVGGYAVAPPSLHSSGERYEFAPSLGWARSALLHARGAYSSASRRRRLPSRSTQRM